MIVTITNVSGAPINKLSVGEDGVATGGARDKAIPYPFDWVGELAAAATKVFAVHPADFRHRSALNGSAFTARELWNQVVQARLLTFAQAAQAGRRDVEELFINAV
jgi:ribosomal protein S11